MGKKRPETASEIQTITSRKAVKLILANEGVKFTASFIKKKDNSVRVMNALRGGEKYEAKLSGGDAPYDFKKAKILPVLDLDCGEMKSIPTDRLVALTINDVSYRIED